MTLGGQTVAPEVLESGYEAYMHYCRACHGEKGDGKGPAAAGFRPSPRDFTKGQFKFVAVSPGDLPNDADFVRIVKGGLHGTAMLPWELSETELHNVIQYIKTFSPRWQKKKAGEPIVASPDPWGQAKKAEAVARGKVVYHVKAMCATCHAYYATRQEIYDMSKAETGTGVTEIREDAYLPIVKDASSYGYGFILPPDFTFRTLRAGEELSDIYRAIAAGVGPMPKWKGALPEQDIWAIAYYGKSLTEMRDPTSARALHTAMLTQPKFVPPPANPAGPVVEPKPL